MTLPLAKENWFCPPPFLSPRLSSGLLAAHTEEKGEGVPPLVFFIRYISDLNHWTTTLRNFKSSPFGPPGSRSSVFACSLEGYADAWNMHAGKILSWTPISKMKFRVCKSEHIPTSA